MLNILENIFVICAMRYIPKKPVFKKARLNECCCFVDVTNKYKMWSILFNIGIRCMETASGNPFLYNSVFIFFEYCILINCEFKTSDPSDRHAYVTVIKK